jgi:hypothetical protein
MCGRGGKHVLHVGGTYLLVYSSSVLLAFFRAARRGVGVEVAMVECQDSTEVLATHNGQAFRFNELVHIFEGTAPGVRAGKTEFMKAWFKGVDVTADKFICRPVIGYSRGPFPRFSKSSVFKVKVSTRTLDLPVWFAVLLTLTLTLVFRCLD